MSRPAASLEVTGGRVDAGGIGTHYLEAGSGFPVLLVHGSGAGVSALANWSRNLEPLGADFHVLAPELAGFGQSDGGASRAYGIDVWVEQLQAFMEALGLPRAHLVGNSLGGWVALELARAHPERVGRLVLMGTGGTPRSLTSTLRQHQAYEPGEQRMRRLLEDFVYDPGLITDELVATRYQASIAPGAAETFRATAAARNRDRETQPLSEDRVRGITTRTLLIHGRDDRVIPAESSWNLARWLPDADLHVLARCGHWSQIEHAGVFNRLVRDFLT